MLSVVCFCSLCVVCWCLAFGAWCVPLLVVSCLLFVCLFAVGLRFVGCICLMSVVSSCFVFGACCMMLSVVWCVVFVVRGLLYLVVAIRICCVVGCWLSVVVRCVIFVGWCSLLVVCGLSCVGRCVLFDAGS